MLEIYEGASGHDTLDKFERTLRSNPADDPVYIEVEAYVVREDSAN